MADKKPPQLGSYPKGIKEVYDMIKNPEYVRETTRPANIIREINRGTPSTVVRSAGYNKLFETFIKNGISRATINKFKSIPDIADFDNAKAYSEALKKFRNTAFKGLSNAQLRVIESSGFLSQYAKEQRLKMLKAGKNFDIKTLNKTLDQLFDYTFIDKKSSVGVKKPKLQSKIYTQIRDMAKSTLNKAQRLNLDYALSQVDDLFKSGKVAKATKMLAGISTLVAKGAFAVGSKALGPLDLLIDASPSPRGTGELPPEEFAKMMEEVKKNNMQETMNKNKGGLMDINHMTRPLGYAIGGDVLDKIRELDDPKRPGEALSGGKISDYEMTELERANRRFFEIEQRLSQGDLTENEAEVLRKEKQRIMGLSPFNRLFEDAKRKYSLSPGQALYDSEGNLITESSGEKLEDIERIYGLKLSPGEKMYDADGNVVTEDQLPYDPDKGYTENLNELMTDIGGTIKEKVKGAGRSLLDKINDFLKYGHGDKEDYMEIGGEQMDPDDPNFRRFIEENYMSEGESYIEGIENYRREVEGQGFRRGGIVSLNHMIRPL